MENVSLVTVAQPGQAQTAVSQTNPLPVQLASGAVQSAVKYAYWNVAASGQNALVAAVTGKKIRVLSYYVQSDADVDATFVLAGSGTALTNLFKLGVKAPAVEAYNPGGHFETTAGVGLNLLLGAAVAARGHLTYVEV
jgi:hypothetical protein